MIMRALLLSVPGTLLLGWANRLIHSGLSGGHPIIAALGIIIALVGLFFALSALAVGARALRDA